MQRYARMDYLRFVGLITHDEHENVSRTNKRSGFLNKDPSANTVAITNT